MRPAKLDIAMTVSRNLCSFIHLRMSAIFHQCYKICATRLSACGRLFRKILLKALWHSTPPANVTRFDMRVCFDIDAVIKLASNLYVDVAKFAGGESLVLIFAVFAAVECMRWL